MQDFKQQSQYWSSDKVLNLCFEIFVNKQVHKYED